MIQVQLLSPRAEKSTQLEEELRQANSCLTEYLAVASAERDTATVEMVNQLLALFIFTELCLYVVTDLTDCVGVTANLYHSDR